MLHFTNLFLEPVCHILSISSLCYTGPWHHSIKFLKMKRLKPKGNRWCLQKPSAPCRLQALSQIQIRRRHSVLGELGRAAFLKMLNPGGLNHNQWRGRLQSADTALNRAPLTLHYSIRPCPPHRSGAPQPSSCSSLGDPRHRQGSHEGGGTALPQLHWPLSLLSLPPAPGPHFLPTKPACLPEEAPSPPGRAPIPVHPPLTQVS